MSRVISVVILGSFDLILEDVCVLSLFLLIACDPMAVGNAMMGSSTLISARHARTSQGESLESCVPS